MCNSNIKKIENKRKKNRGKSMKVYEMEIKENSQQGKANPTAIYFLKSFECFILLHFIVSNMSDVHVASWSTTSTVRTLFS